MPGHEAGGDLRRREERQVHHVPSGREASDEVARLLAVVLRRQLQRRRPTQQPRRAVPLPPAPEAPVIRFRVLGSGLRVM